MGFEHTDAPVDGIFRFCSRTTRFCRLHNLDVCCGVDLGLILVLLVRGGYETLEFALELLVILLLNGARERALFDSLVGGFDLLLIMESADNG